MKYLKNKYRSGRLANLAYVLSWMWSFVVLEHGCLTQNKTTALTVSAPEVADIITEMIIFSTLIVK